MFNTIKFNYFSLGPGECTIAYQVDSNKNSTERQVRFGYSFCSPKDTFTKADVYATVLPPIDRDTNKRPLVNGRPLSNEEIPKFISSLPRTNKLVVQGGRSRAMERLEKNPVCLTVHVPVGDSPTHYILTALQEEATKRAPLWKNRVELQRIERNIYGVSRGDQAVIIRIVDDADADHLVEVCDANDIREDNIVLF